MLKKTILIGYFIQEKEIQCLKYCSAGERHEILCVRTQKLVIYMTSDESLSFLVQRT